MLPSRFSLKCVKASALGSLISLASISFNSYGDNIYQVYQDAVANDPIIRAAAASLKAEQEGKNAALGQMLPQIGFNFSLSQNENTTNQNITADEYKLKQDSQSYTFGVKQKVFNLATWYQFKGASELSKKAELDFRQNEQELITRTIDSYFKVLRAYDNLSSSFAEEAAFKQQLDQTQQRFDVGLVAITDVHESQAAFDLAKVNRLSNQGILLTTYENLTLLTGKAYDSVALISETLPITDPAPADRNSWVEMATKGNLQLLATELTTASAKYKYKQAASAHLPTVELQFTHNQYDMVGGDLYDANNNQIISAKEWEQQIGDLPATTTNTVSLNFNLPIFTGGTTSANRRGAFAQYDAAKEQLSGTQRSVIQNTRASHIAVQTQIQTVAARKQAITSAQSAVDAIEAGYQVGTRNIVDVLNAQRNLYNSQRDYANARYDYIEAMFQLKLSAGLLSAGDIQTLNEYIDNGKPATEEAALDALHEEKNS